MVVNSLPTMTVDVSLCGSIPRSSFRAGGKDSSVVAVSPRFPSGSHHCELVSENNCAPSDPGLTHDSTTQNGISSSSLKPKPVGPKSETSACQYLVAPTPAIDPVKVFISARLSTDKIGKDLSTFVSKERDQTVVVGDSNATLSSQSFANQIKTSVSGESLLEMNPIISSSTIDIPIWAVPATGDSRLEPVREGNIFHAAVDLTKHPVFQFGRSPSNHVVLFHRTASRRHAVVFHHPSGACYLRDCQSAHGTFVNGVRVSSKALTKLRRGSLVRFGGPGAPSFVLKSFSTSFGRMVQDLDGVATSFEQTASNKVPILRQQAKQTGVACIRGDSGMACVVAGKDAPIAALVLLNTRLNASGGLSTLGEDTKCLAITAKHRYEEKISCSPHKRSREEFFDVPAKKAKLFGPKSILTHVTIEATPCAFVTPSASAEFLPIRPRKVSFSDEQPIAFFPAAVTPDEFSSDSEADDEEHIVLMEPVSVSTM
jgi:hypothetical protein